MQTTTCVNCGASIDPGSKFCRRCGRPLDTGNPLDPSELTTRELREPPRYEATTQPSNPAYTSPAYLPPEAFLPQAQSTREIGQAGQKKAIITLSIIIAALLVALSALAIYMIARQSDEPARATMPMPPPVDLPQPPVVPRPPIPPSAPSAPGGSSIISSELIYPGAEITMGPMGGRKGKVVGLLTSDNFEKVVEWYTERIKPNNPLRFPGNAVLEGEGVTAVITGGSGKTSIIVTQKSGR
jgi:zinc ribbon protein